MSISVPSVTVNNNPYGISPNSAKYSPGYGESNMRAASNGGGSVSMVYSENAEGKVGKVSFDMYCDDTARDLIKECKNNGNTNVVVLSQSGFNSIRLTGAALTNEPESELSADGNVTLEFKGAPIDK